MINENELQHPKEFSINGVFSNTEYEIPIYQRSYAWTKDEIEQLLTDINDSEGRYFIGSLIVDNVENDKFMVIDGQQRLTTIYLLLTYLSDSSINSNSLTFEAREKSNRTLKFLFAQKEYPPEDSIYSPEIILGYKIISDWFETCVNKFGNNFVTIFKSKLSNIFIIRTLVPKKIDLNHYFEIMNTRGEQLEIHEIAKGRLIGVIEDANDKELAGYIWDSCSQMDKYVQMCFDVESREKLFGDDWNHFLSKDFSDLRNNIKIKKLLSEKKFSLKSKLDNPINNAENSKTEIEENERFESVVSFPNFLLIANESLSENLKDTKDNDASLDDKKFIDELKKHWKSNDSALDFVFQLLKLRYLFDKYIVKREFARNYQEDGKWSLQHLEMYYDSSKKSKKPLYKLTYNVSEDESGTEKTVQLRTLQSALRITYTSPKTMHWISKSLFALNNDEQTDLIEVLEKYACSKVQEANYLTATGFGVDRIIFTYLDYILYRDNKDEFNDFQFQFRTSIEHFFPQNPINNDKWNSDDLNCFGNLALITVSANSKFSNLYPKSKVDSYKEIILQSPKLMRMKKLLDSRNDWTEKEAKEHDKEMKEILKIELLKQK